MVEIQNAKGTRDIPPEEQILKSKIVGTLRRTFELYGYNPLDTPILERYDVLSSKYAGGAEILKETFKLKDQGDRELCLRYDLTVPLARYIAMNPNVKLPFKRYQLGEVFRDGPIKAGRFRQFMQCDVDAVGTKDLFTDAELLKISDDVFKELGFDILIKVNSRKLLDAIMEYSGIPDEKWMDAILSLDKLDKVGKDKVLKELEQKGIPIPSSEKLFSLTEASGGTDAIFDNLRSKLSSEKGKMALEELEKVFTYLKLLGVEAILSPGIARGLTYYTGPIFEVYLKGSEISSSIAAGGRYDDMIGQFVGGPQKYPAVGLSFGVDVIMEAVRRQNIKLRKSLVKVLIIPIRTESEAIKLLGRIREAGIPAELNTEKKGVSKGLEYASSYQVPFVIFLGEEEVSKQKVKLRDMVTGNEELLDEGALIQRIREDI